MEAEKKNKKKRMEAEYNHPSSNSKSFPYVIILLFSPQEIEEIEKSEKDEKEFEELVSFIQQRLSQTEVK